MKRRKSKSSKAPLWWIGGVLGSLACVFVVYIIGVNVASFFEAIKGLEYGYKPNQKYAYQASLVVPRKTLSWSADIEYEVEAGGKISYATKMQLPRSNFESDVSVVSNETETGNFDLPRNGFGGFINLEGTHRFPFFMGPVATAPIVPLGAGKGWNYEQQLELTVDRPMYGLQPGDTLTAIWNSRYTVKFQAKNQTVIVEERTIVQTGSGNSTILTATGEHTFDDRSGLHNSKLQGRYEEPDSQLNVAFEYSLVKQ